MEMAGDIGPMGQVDIQVPHAGVGCGDLGERAVDARASAAHFGAELEEGRGVAESVGAEPCGVDDLVMHVASHPSLSCTQQHADCGGDGDERGHTQEGGDGFHGIPH